MMFESATRRKKLTDYQNLRIRCQMCGRMNSATDIACRYCGANLFKADVIRGTDYERFDANDLRKSCLLAIVPGLGLFRERRWIEGTAMFSLTVVLSAFLFFGFARFDESQIYLSALSLVLVSIASVFVTFLSALNRMGVPRPEGRETLILLGRLLVSYALVAFALVFWWTMPASLVALWLAWRISQPFFGKAMD